MTRRLGAGLSRRQVVRGLLGGAGALIGTAVAKQAGSAQNCLAASCDDETFCCASFECNNGICVCPLGTTWCHETDSCAAECCSDWECNGGICDGGICIADPCADCGPCDTCDPAFGCVSQCEEGEVCNDGICEVLVEFICVNTAGGACTPGVQGSDCCAGLTCSGVPSGGGSGICCPNEYCPNDGGYCYSRMTGGCCDNSTCGDGWVCENRTCTPELGEPTCVDTAGGTCNPSEELDCCAGLTCSGVPDGGGPGICCPFQYCADGNYCYHDQVGGCCTDDECGNGTCEGGQCVGCIGQAGAVCQPSVEDKDCCGSLTCYGHDTDPGGEGICCPFQYCAEGNYCYHNMVGGCCTDDECGNGECVDGQCVECIGEAGATCTPGVEGEDCCGGLTCSGVPDGGGSGICCPFSYCPDDGGYCYHTAVGGCCTDDQCGGGECIDRECVGCIGHEGAVCQPSVEDKDCCGDLTCYGITEPGGEGICCPFSYCPKDGGYCYHTMVGGCCGDEQCGDGWICHSGTCVEACKEKGDHCEYEDDCCDGLFCGYKDKCREVCKEIYDDCHNDWQCCDHLVCHHGKCKDLTPHCKEKYDYCGHDDDCCHGLICRHGKCLKKHRRHKPHHHDHHHGTTPAGGTETVTTLPTTGAGSTAGSGFASAALAGGAAALFAAKILRRKPAEEGQNA
jgi:hypothetical protein